MLTISVYRDALSTLYTNSHEPLHCIVTSTATAHNNDSSLTHVTTG